MDKVEKRSLIKSLLSGRLTRKQRKDFADLEPINIEIRKQWNESGNRHVSVEIKEQIWEKIKDRCDYKKRNQVLVRLGRYCVAAVFMLLVGIWVLMEKDDSHDFVEIIADHYQLHILPDSSKVWMEEGSSIRYAYDFQKGREVWISGNGLFEVTKQSGEVFMVHLPDAFIEVTGTTFLVKQDTADVNEVLLFDGGIAFHVKSTQEVVNVLPMQKVIYDPQCAAVQLETIPRIRWDNGRYYFRNTPLNELIAFINQMYHAHIVFGKESQEEIEFSGYIRNDESLEEVIDKVCFALNLTPRKIEEKRIIIE